MMYPSPEYIKGWNAGLEWAANIAAHATHGEMTRRHPDEDIPGAIAWKDLAYVSELILEGRR